MPPQVTSQSLTGPAPATPTSAATTADNVSDQQQEGLKNQIKDLNEKLETLKLKRAEDREKLREIDKLKLQLQQLQEFKSKAQEAISGLNKEIQQAKIDAASLKEEYESYKDEMSSHETRLEEMTVDKELAEAKTEELQDELTKLTEKYEETKLELEVLKGEIEVNGVQGAQSSFQNKKMEQDQETLKSALIK
jgi:dynactin 1